MANLAILVDTGDKFPSLVLPFSDNFHFQVSDSKTNPPDMTVDGVSQTDQLTLSRRIVNDWALKHRHAGRLMKQKWNRLVSGERLGRRLREYLAPIQRRPVGSRIQPSAKHLRDIAVGLCFR